MLIEPVCTFYNSWCFAFRPSGKHLENTVGPHFSLWTSKEGYLAQQTQKNFSSPFVSSLQLKRIREFPAVGSSYYLAVAGRRVWFHGSKSSINQRFWERVKKGCSTADAMGGAHTRPYTWPHTHTWFVLSSVPFEPQPPRWRCPVPIPLRYTLSSPLHPILKTCFQKKKFKTHQLRVYMFDRV